MRRRLGLGLPSEMTDMSTHDTQMDAIADYVREQIPVPIMLPLLMKLLLLRLTD